MKDRLRVWIPIPDILGPKTGALPTAPQPLAKRAAIAAIMGEKAVARHVLRMTARDGCQLRVRTDRLAPVLRAKKT